MTNKGVVKDYWDANLYDVNHSFVGISDGGFIKPILYNGEKWLADYKRICVIGLKE